MPVNAGEEIRLTMFPIQYLKGSWNEKYGFEESLQSDTRR